MGNRPFLVNRLAAQFQLPFPCAIMNRLRGFTMIELMVVIAIVAILARIAVPSFTSLMRKNKLSAASSAFQVSLSLARSEAIKRGADAKVTVAPKAVGDWSSGWAVFVDQTTNANGGVAPTSDSATVTRIEVVAAPSGPVSVGTNAGALKYFMYNGQGRVQSAIGGPGNDSVWFYDGASSDKYCVVVSVGGRARTDIVASSASCPAS